MQTMGTNQNINLPLELWTQVSEMARAEGRATDELFEEAVRRFIKLRGLRSFVAANSDLAAERGLTEVDVPRLIAESRRERARH
jgi:hypothetical protein